MVTVRQCGVALPHVVVIRAELRRNTTCNVRTGIIRSSKSHSLFTEAITSIPAPLVPPAAFTGFFLTLWMYKCLTLVMLQNKIIYMPGLPPGSRSETIENYSNQCGSVAWEERHIKSLDGTDLALAVSRIARAATPVKHEALPRTKSPVILYFQGNGASIPPRLPQLSRTLEAINAVDSASNTNATIIALSYRGYWKSRGAPSQHGIEQDAIATLEHARHIHPDSRIILWGQSIGAGVATTLLAAHLQRSEAKRVEHGIAGLVLETPFISLKGMLTALYPQKWLPYRYLHPFLRSHWDSEVALRNISATVAGRAIPILLVAAGKDELVPAEQGRRLAQLCEISGMDVRTRVAAGALHVEAMSKVEGRRAVADFVGSIVKSAHVED